MAEQQNNPSLACESCNASMPLALVVILDGYLRRITCPECGTVTTWSLVDRGVVDLREGTRAPAPVEREGCS